MFNVMIKGFLNDLNSLFPTLHLARNGLFIFQGFIDRKEVLHLIENVGDDTLVTLIWANELYDPERPDTYYLEV